MKLVMALATVTMLLTGCLKTRNEVRDNEQRQVMQQQVVTLQKTNADATSRFSELEEQMRELTGRVDVVENRVTQGSAGTEGALKSAQQQNVDLTQKVGLLQEELTKMENQIYALNAEVNALRTAKAAAVAEKPSRGGKNAYQTAEDYFEKKDWKQAILNYQKYRDENPHGGKFADATYKIGVSFQELGMKEEAKTFYDEVANKFPKSDEARRAKVRLKGMKK